MLRIFDLSGAAGGCDCLYLPCLWENDVFVTSDDEPSDENHGISLRTAQENYRSFGACARTMLRYVREPKPEEIPQ